MINKTVFCQGTFIQQAPVADCYAKICHFGKASFCCEYVRPLNISMKYTLNMQVLQADKNLTDIGATNWL